MTSARASRKTPARETIRTTLYDLTAAVIEHAEAAAESAITAVVAHLLNAHGATCLGDFAGYRFVCEAEAASSDASHLCASAFLAVVSEGDGAD